MQRISSSFVLRDRCSKETWSSRTAVATKCSADAAHVQWGDVRITGRDEGANFQSIGIFEGTASAFRVGVTRGIVATADQASSSIKQSLKSKKLSSLESRPPLALARALVLFLWGFCVFRMGIGSLRS